MGKFNPRRLDQTGRILSLKSGAPRFGLSKGQSAVEFAMVCSLFFFLLFAVIDYAWLMFARMNVQQAVDDGGRYASTGQNNGTSRIASIITTVQNEISVPGVSAANLQICSTPPLGTVATCYYGSPTNPSGPPGSAGGPEYTVTLTLVTSLPLMTPMLAKLFPGGVYTFTASSTFKNEPFDPSNTN